MKDTTIVTDVEKSPRETMMETLIAKRRSGSTTAPVELEGELEQEELGEQGELEQDLEDGKSTEEDYITLKVDGQEVRTTKDKVHEAGVRALQKESSADRRLAEAAAKDAELTKRREELDRLEQELLSKSGNEDSDEVGRKFAESLYTDEDEVAKTISGMSKQIADLKRQQDDLLSATKKAAAEKAAATQGALEVATKHFFDKYMDIAEDDEKTTLFNKRLQEAIKENPTVPVTEAVDKAAEMYYSKYGGKPAKVKTDKQEIKEKLLKQPPPGSARRTLPPEEKPKTRTDRLNEMRSKRSVAG